MYSCFMDAIANRGDIAEIPFFHPIQTCLNPVASMRVSKLA